MPINPDPMLGKNCRIKLSILDNSPEKNNKNKWLTLRRFRRAFSTVLSRDLVGRRVGLACFGRV